MAIFHDDGTVTMTGEEYAEHGRRAKTGYDLEMAVIWAQMCLYPNLYSDEDVVMAREEFQHATRTYLDDLHALTKGS